MIISGLVNRIRTEFLDDAVGSEGTRRWKTPNIISSLSQAERELCRRLLLLHDSTTAAICQIAVTATLGVYPRAFAIDNRILRVERLKFPGVTTPLTRTTTAYLDGNDPGWDELTGTPSHYIVDTDDYTITLNRQPLLGGTIQLTVKRLPLTPLIERLQTDSPDLKQFDDEMIHGALKYLYIKPDVETFNANLSDRWSKQFESDITLITQNRAAMNPQINICKPERF